jgi:hypothetical protein
MPASNWVVIPSFSVLLLFCSRSRNVPIFGPLDLPSTRDDAISDHTTTRERTSGGLRENIPKVGRDIAGLALPGGEQLLLHRCAA